MANKMNLQEEIRRITNETAANAAAKALEVAEMAKTKAAEVSTLAIAEALKAATLAATKAAEAAAAAAQIAASTSKDLEYIKKDIAETKTDIAKINEKLDNKYTTKDETSSLRKELEETKKVVDSYSQYPTVKAIVYGLCAIILTSVMGGLMYLVINK